MSYKHGGVPSALDDRMNFIRKQKPLLIIQCGKRFVQQHTDCALLFLNLASIKFSNRALDRFDGAVLVMMQAVML